MNNRSEVASVVLFLALALGACSKAAPRAPESAGAAEAAATPAVAATAAAAAPLPHPCTLLTAADVEEVLGAGASLTRDSESTCLLRSATADSQIGVKMAELDRDTWDGGEMMMTMDKDAKKLTDIGEGAYTYMGGNVVFAKGHAEVTVVMSLYKGSLPALDAAQIIAKKVAAAL
jgi:hypothetical protein